MGKKGGKVDTRLRPMKARDAERALRTLEFEREDPGATSHTHWKKIRNGRMYKVTLDAHGGEVKKNDLRSMIKQAGVSRKQWYLAAAGVESEEEPATESGAVAASDPEE